MDSVTNVEWLNLAASVASLFVGGYAGGRSAGVARFRTDKRQLLLEDLLPQLKAGPPTKAAAAEEWAEAYERVGVTCEILPLAERHVWSMAQLVLPDEEYRRAMSAQDSQEAQKGHLDDVLARHAEAINDEHYDTALDELENVLRLHLRPSVLSPIRWAWSGGRVVLTTVGHYLRGFFRGGG